MTVTVLDSADLVQSVITGTIPVPKGIAEDNASQAAKREAKPEDVPEHKSKQGSDSTTIKGAANDSTQDNHGGAQKNQDDADADTGKAGTKGAQPNPDDVEGDDGLTPRQKREFTEAMQRTIGKKHRKQMEAEEFALAQYNEKQLAEQRAENLERELKALKEANKPTPAKVEEAKAPERKDFETDQAYQDALIDFRVDQKFKAQEATAARQREEQRQAEVVQHAKAKIERAIELVPDFKDVTDAVDMVVPPYIAGYMQESDMFAELGYHFAKHPDVLEGLAKMNPARALVEVGKIESTLTPFAPKAKAEDAPAASQTNGDKPSTETGSAPSKPRVQAPIIRPLNTGSAPQVGKAEEDMNPSQVITAWQRKNRVNLTGRKRH